MPLTGNKNLLLPINYTNFRVKNAFHGDRISRYLVSFYLDSFTTQCTLAVSIGRGVTTGALSEQLTKLNRLKCAASKDIALSIYMHIEMLFFFCIVFCCLLFCLTVFSFDHFVFASKYFIKTVNLINKVSLFVISMRVCENFDGKNI